MEPRAYYNEIDKYAVRWLKRLMADGLIMDGDVDDRPIEEVQAADLEGYVRCHFFSGIAGWDYALQLAGWPDNWPIWTGSCPCQPFSAAGKRKGVNDERHVWPAFHRLIAECRPSVCFGEQVDGPDGRKWLSGVRADMEADGYRFGFAGLPAASVGAPHKRARLWWVADAYGERQSNDEGWARSTEQNGGSFIAAISSGQGVSRWLPQPDVDCVVHGISANPSAVRGYGNAIVPQVAAVFIRSYMEVVGPALD